MTVHHPLVTSMLATIRRHSMVESGDKVLVAVSGGPDSVTLLHALWTLRPDLEITLHIAHLNHSFRGKESDEDAEYVRKLAAKLGIGCTVEKIDVPAIQKTLRVSAEEAARLVRYDFLERTAVEDGAARIAVGHTANDQVETVMLNILRGTGVDGLSGIPTVRGKIIRPLIDIRRAEVESYAEEHNLHPRTDVTNLVPAYTRNKLRLDLLPLLRREYNPEIDSAILRLSELAREDTAYINMKADEALHALTVDLGEGVISLDPSGLRACSLAIRRRVVRQAVKSVRGELIDVGFIHIEELLRLLDVGTDFRYELPGGTFVRLSGGKLAFLSSRPSEIPIIYCHEIAVPGTTPVPEIQSAVETQLSPNPVNPVRPPGSAEIVLDYGAVSGKLRVRNWQPGDRIQPLGLHGTKKVQDIFVDRKIPRDARYRVPLIVDDEKIIWIAGIALSEQVKVTGSTREFLTLRIEPGSGEFGEIHNP